MEKENVVEEVVETTETVEVEETESDKLSREIRENMDKLEKALEEDNEDGFHEELMQKLDRIKKDQEKIAQDIARREKETFQREVALSLESNGLEAFADIINVNDSEELSDVVAKLTAIVNDIKVGAGYVPKENAKQSEYDVYAQKKDTKGMIGSKLANLFKSH